jgi:N-acetylneuraminate lyase
MKKHLLEGLIAAAFTPMDNDDNINLRVIHDYAIHLVKSGVSGVFVCGTTGESLSLTTIERKAILEEWVKCSKGNLKIICHVGGNSLPESIELASHAAIMGADAIGAFSPSFFKPSSARDLVEFLSPIARAASGLPFYYYHMPSMTGVQLPVIDLLNEMNGSISNFAGVKFTHYDLFDMQQCIAFQNGKYEILHGYDEILLAGLSLGVKAAVGSTYNYMSKIYIELWEAHNNNNMDIARSMQQFSVDLVKILIKYGGGVRAGKAIMEFIGISCGPCRLPIRKFSHSELIELKNELDLSGFFRFNEITIS